MAMPAENYTITNCTMLSGHGGVVIGSEMSGGVKKITISNCVFDGTDRGIRIKTARGRGGVVEDIRVSNIVMKNIREEAIVLTMFYQKSSPEPVSERTPVFRNMHFSNITAQTNRAIHITGIEEMPVEDITFNDVQFDARTGVELREARNIAFHKVRISTTSGPALFAENVSTLEIDGVQPLQAVAATPVILLKNTGNVFLHTCFPPEGTGIFVELQGERTKRVVLRNNNFQHAGTTIKKGNEVKEDITLE
jgi:polygalacturonase